MKKRIIAMFLMLIIVLAPIFSATEETAEEKGFLEPPVLQNVGAACVYNIENDRYIFEQEADKEIYPASTVKLMTAILAVESLGDQMDRQVTVPKEALVNVSGNSIGLKLDEIVTVEQLLWALITGCANDAANVLAIEVAGSIEDFVALMNEKAKEIGAVNTNYTNPTGLHHPLMVTTAKDTAIVSAYALGLSPIADMASAEKYVMEPTNKVVKRTIYNKNYYFATNREYLYIWRVPRGLNAGYTKEGGWCISTSASRDGLTYIAVVMGASEDDKYIYSFTEAADLIKWALDAYDYTGVVTTSDIICEVPVRLAGNVDYVALFPAQDVELFLPTGIDVKKDIDWNWTLTEKVLVAPVSERQTVGELTLTYNGVKLGTYDLITRNSVNRNNMLYVLDLLREVVMSDLFRTVLIVAAVLAAGYVAAVIYLYIYRTRSQRTPRASKKSAPPSQPRNSHRR